MLGLHMLKFVILEFLPEYWRSYLCIITCCFI